MRLHAEITREFVGTDPKEDHQIRKPADLERLKKRKKKLYDIHTGTGLLLSLSVLII